MSVEVPSLFFFLSLSLFRQSTKSPISKCGLEKITESSDQWDSCLILNHTLRFLYLQLTTDPLEGNTSLALIILICSDIEDLVDVFPDEGDSFIKILDWPAETMDEFNHSFNSMAFEVQYDFFGEIRNIELKPNGKNEMLTYDCRKVRPSYYMVSLTPNTLEPSPNSLEVPIPWKQRNQYYS